MPKTLMATKLIDGVVSWREFLLGDSRVLVHEVIYERDGIKVLYWVKGEEDPGDRVTVSKQFSESPLTDRIYGQTYGTEEDKARRVVCARFMKEFSVT